MRYSIEFRDKYDQKLLDSTKKSRADAIKIPLIGNKIANKITSVPKKSPTELYSMELHSKKLWNDEMEAPKRRYIYAEERQQIIDELRLV